jgi:spore coat protein CotF
MTYVNAVEEFTSSKMSEFVSMMTHVNAVEDFTSSKMSEFVSIMTHVNTVDDFTSNKLSEFVSMMTCVDSACVIILTNSDILLLVNSSTALTYVITDKC